MQLLQKDIQAIVAIWIVGVLYVEAMTEIVVASKLMFPIRDYLTKKSLKKVGESQSWYGYLIHCGHCMSVWVAFTAVWFLPVIVEEYWVADILGKWFAIHRLSNILHSWIQPRINREPWLIEIVPQTKELTLTMDDEIDESF